MSDRKQQKIISPDGKPNSFGSAVGHLRFGKRIVILSYDGCLLFVKTLLGQGKIGSKFIVKTFAFIRRV